MITTFITIDLEFLDPSKNTSISYFGVDAERDAVLDLENFRANPIHPEHGLIHRMNFRMTDNLRWRTHFFKPFSIYHGRPFNVLGPEAWTKLVNGFSQNWQIELSDTGEIIHAEVEEITQ